MGTREPSFAAFRRHRYRAHMQGWLLLSLGVATVAYVPTLPNEPLWLAVPVAFLAAVFVVAIGVLAAGLLRFPWWLLAPLTFVSMAIEWGLRKVWHRPWCRRPQPSERFLSNPFALWQRRRLRRLRRRRTSQRTGAEVIPLPHARLAAPVPRVASPPATSRCNTPSPHALRRHRQLPPSPSRLLPSLGVGTGSGRSCWACGSAAPGVAMSNALPYVIGSARTGLTGPYAFAPQWTFQRRGALQKTSRRRARHSTPTFPALTAMPGSISPTARPSTVARARAHAGFSVTGGAGSAGGMPDYKSVRWPMAATFRPLPCCVYAPRAREQYVWKWALRRASCRATGSMCWPPGSTGEVAAIPAGPG